jgi:hypothetical protein
VPTPVRDAWARAIADWDDARRHDELLQLVATHNTYAWAAGRYQTHGRDAIAERQLERLRHAAEATLFASATVGRARATRPYHATLGVLATLIAVVAVSLWYAMVVCDRPRPARERPIPVRYLTPGHPVSPSTIK